MPSRGPHKATAQALLLVCALSGPAAADVLTVVCGRDDREYRLCVDSAEAWARDTGHEVRVAQPPAQAAARLALFEQLLGVGSPEIDVLELDVIWPGRLADQLLDLAPHLGNAIDAFDPALIANNTVAGRLLALPWFLDFGLLYYRADLLDAAGIAPPETWAELESAATRIQDGERFAGNGGFWGYLWQGWEYEGLTCNVMEWLGSWGGGTLVAEDGSLSIPNPEAEYALKRPTRWLALISPESVLVYTESESLEVFRQGNAAFLRHWPGAWASLQAEDSPVRGKVGFAALPRGGPQGQHSATVGGWQLAVSRHSRNPSLAVDLLRHLAGAEAQRRRALAAALVPARSGLHGDPELREALPLMDLLVDGRVQLVARPATATGRQYPEVSELIQNWVSEILAGRVTGERGLGLLAEELEQLSEGGLRW